MGFFQLLCYIYRQLRLEFDILFHSCGYLSCGGICTLRSIIDEANHRGDPFAEGQRRDHPLHPNVAVHLRVFLGIHPLLCLRHQQCGKRRDDLQRL